MMRFVTSGLLSALCLSSLPPSLSPNSQPSEPRTLSYDDHLRDLIDEERKYVRHLNLIMKVFMEPFQNKNLFTQQVSLLSYETYVHVHKIMAIELLGQGNLQ